MRSVDLRREGAGWLGEGRLKGGRGEVGGRGGRLVGGEGRVEG